MELETRFAMAVRQRELLENYIRERLKPAKHFYKIDDNEKAKPSLTKEGAELICLPHNLKPRYAIISGPDSPPMDETPYQITVNCEMLNGTNFGGQGLGSASSMITKRSGERVQRQKDPGLRHNATLKMACKSAYIAATLNSTAASEFFTQDLEDMQAEDLGRTNSQDTKEHWCKEHNTAFFMRGKMKSFAHPIGDSGEWCHEHTDKPGAETKPQEGTGQPETPPDLATLEFANPGEFYTACLNHLKVSKTQADKEIPEYDLSNPAQRKRAWELLVSLFVK